MESNITAIIIPPETFYMPYRPRFACLVQPVVEVNTSLEPFPIPRPTIIYGEDALNMSTGQKHCLTRELTREELDIQAKFDSAVFAWRQRLITTLDVAAGSDDDLADVAQNKRAKEIHTKIPEWEGFAPGVVRSEIQTHIASKEDISKTRSAVEEVSGWREVDGWTVLNENVEV